MASMPLAIPKDEWERDQRALFRAHVTQREQELAAASQPASQPPPAMGTADVLDQEYGQQQRLASVQPPAETPPLFQTGAIPPTPMPTPAPAWPQPVVETPPTEAPDPAQQQQFREYVNGVVGQAETSTVEPQAVEQSDPVQQVATYLQGLGQSVSQTAGNAVQSFRDYVTRSIGPSEPDLTPRQRQYGDIREAARATEAEARGTFEEPAEVPGAAGLASAMETVATPARAALGASGVTIPGTETVIPSAALGVVGSVFPAVRPLTELAKAAEIGERFRQGAPEAAVITEAARRMKERGQDVTPLDLAKEAAGVAIERGERLETASLAGMAESWVRDPLNLIGPEIATPIRRAAGPVGRAVEKVVGRLGRAAEQAPGGAVSSLVRETAETVPMRPPQPVEYGPGVPETPAVRGLGAGQGVDEQALLRLADSDTWLDDAAERRGRAWLEEDMSKRGEHESDLFSRAREDATADTEGRGVAQLRLRPEDLRSDGRLTPAGRSRVDGFRVSAQDDSFVVGREQVVGDSVHLPIAERPPEGYTTGGESVYGRPASLPILEEQPLTRGQAPRQAARVAESAAQPGAARVPVAGAVQPRLLERGPAYGAEGLAGQESLFGEAEAAVPHVTYQAQRIGRDWAVVRSAEGEAPQVVRRFRSQREAEGDALLRTRDASQAETGYDLNRGYGTVRTEDLLGGAQPTEKMAQDRLFLTQGQHGQAPGPSIAQRAVGGAVSGAVSDLDEDLSPEERTRRGALGAAADVALGAVGGRLPGVRRLGGTVLRAVEESGLTSDIGKLPKGETFAFGPDPSKVYRFRFRVVDLDDLVPSQTDTLARNPAYTAGKQPRLRDRAVSQMQIGRIVNEFQPEALLTDTHALDTGPMIVDANLQVESGNGRVLALRQMSNQAPEKLGTYEQQLANQLADYGVPATELEGKAHPILVRERLTDVDPAQFAREANQRASLGVSPFELAIQDAANLSDDVLTRLEVGEDQTIEQALRSAANRSVARSFMGTVPSNEQADLLDANGVLNQQGLERLKAAIFARTFPGQAGERLAETFFESVDPVVKNIQNALLGALPNLARVEAMIRLGDRGANLAIGDDLAQAVDMYARLKQQGYAVEDYVRQAAFFERQTTPFQDALLEFFSQNTRSAKPLRSLLREYASLVEAQPAQAGLLGDTGKITKGDLLDEALRRLRENPPDEGLFAAAERAVGETGPIEPAMADQGGPPSEGRPQLEKPPAGKEVGQSPQPAPAEQGTLPGGEPPASSGRRPPVKPIAAVPQELPIFGDIPRTRVERALDGPGGPGGPGGPNGPGGSLRQERARGRLLRTIGERQGITGIASKATKPTEIDPETLKNLPNLTKIDAPEDILASLIETAQANPRLLETWRQGVITWDELISDLAPKLGMTAEDFLKTKIGQAFNQTEMLVLRAAVDSKKDDLLQLGEEIAAKGGAAHDLASEELRAAFHRGVAALSPEEKVAAIMELTDGTRLQAVARGGAATAGRTLNQQKILMTQEMARGLTAANERAAIAKARPAAEKKAADAATRLTAVDKTIRERAAARAKELEDAAVKRGIAKGQADAAREGQAWETVRLRVEAQARRNAEALMTTNERIEHKAAQALAKADSKATMAQEGMWLHYLKKQEQESARAAKKLADDAARELKALQTRSARIERQVASFEARTRQNATRVLEKLGGAKVTDKLLADFLAVTYQGDPLLTAKFLRSLNKVSWWDRSGILRYASMLSATVTHTMQATSNTLQLGGMVATHPLAVGLDIGVQAVHGGQRTRYMAELPAALSQAQAGWTLGLQQAGIVMREGIHPGEITRLDKIAPGFAFEQTRIGQAIGERASNVVNVAAELPLRALVAGDVVIRETARAMTAGGLATRQAIREGYTGAARITRTQEIMANLEEFPEIVDEANKIAHRVVLQEHRVEMQPALAFRQQPIAGGLISFPIPFMRTPYNIAAQGAGMTPAGLIGVIQAASTGRRGEAVDRAARAVIGTAVMGGAEVMYANGMLTGAMPEDERERSTLPRGWQPWSFRVQTPDGQTRYISYQNLGPVAIPFAVVAIKNDALKRSAYADSPVPLAKIVSGVGRFMIDQTFLRGLNDVMRGVMDYDRYGERWEENIASQFVPYGALQRQLQRAFGMSVRDPHGAIEAMLATSSIPGLLEATAKVTGEALASTSPLTAGTVRTKQDPLGRPIPLQPTGITAMVSPARITTEKDEPVLAELRRYSVGIPSVGKTLQGMPITEDERREYRTIAGTAILDSVAAVMQDPWYRRATSVERHELLEKSVLKARKDAAAELMNRFTRAEIEKRFQVQGGKRQTELERKAG